MIIQQILRFGTVRSDCYFAHQIFDQHSEFELSTPEVTNAEKYKWIMCNSFVNMWIKMWIS